MKHYITTIVLLATTYICAMAQGQTSEQQEYRRSSIYSLLINHTEQNFADEICTAFMAMPVPDKYNDHDLSVKVLDMTTKLKKAKSDKENSEITEFLEQNNIASRLVGKWFNRDIFEGTCDMELVKARGLYNANHFDQVMAEKSQRSQALLMDAGEDLIGNTFVLVNDIRYVDKSKKSQGWGIALSVLGGLAGAATGNSNFSRLGNNLATIAESVKGFKVRVNTFLYQLVWDEATAANFYTNHYASEPDAQKCAAFDNARSAYRLKYVGKVESKGSTTSFMGVNMDEPINMVRKACQRALDENVADLAHDFEDFRTKVPLVSTAPITAYVGLKEGVSSKSRFEVLEVEEDEKGMRHYKRVGVIKPVANLIWDNRYMSVEEGAENATLGSTTFKKVSGGDFFPGMLIREIED